jgi:Fe-S-cluster containining protein
VTIDTANACEFCGAVCNDGTAGWVLLDFVGACSDAARAFFVQLQRG